MKEERSLKVFFQLPSKQWICSRSRSNFRYTTQGRRKVCKSGGSNVVTGHNMPPPGCYRVDWSAKIWKNSDSPAPLFQQYCYNQTWPSPDDRGIKMWQGKYSNMLVEYFNPSLPTWQYICYILSISQWRYYNFEVIFECWHTHSQK